MNKLAALFPLMLLVSVVHCMAQTPQALYLSDYTIKQTDNRVGYVRVLAGAIQSIAVGGDYARAFEVGSDHQLMVRHNGLPASTPWVDLLITVTTTTGQHTGTFRLVRDQFIHNKVIAHRGAWKNTGATENSIAALQHAITLGCEGSEFDVHMSADSIPMVNHDPSINGTSIANTSFEALRNIRLANGETLPTLEAYLTAGMRQYKTKLILEIKASELGQASTVALARKIVNLVESMHAQAWVDYISFDYEACKEVMRLAPYARVAYLKGDKTPAELAAEKFYGLDYHISAFRKNALWIKEAKALNLTVNVWTVNDKKDLRDMLEQNVDFITTNEPELLLEMVNR